MPVRKTEAPTTKIAVFHKANASCETSGFRRKNFAAPIRDFYRIRKQRFASGADVCTRPVQPNAPSGTAQGISNKCWICLFFLFTPQGGCCHLTRFYKKYTINRISTFQKSTRRKSMIGVCLLFLTALLMLSIMFSQDICPVPQLNCGGLAGPQFACLTSRHSLLAAQRSQHLILPL